MNTRGRAITITIVTAIVLIALRFLAIDERIVDSPFRLVISAALLFAITTLGTAWVLFYKLNRKFIFTGVLFPFFAFLPFWGFSESLLGSIRDLLGQNLAVIVVSAVLALILYALILTVNILNGARQKDVPLAQAAKAAQFIFVLVASYFYFTFVFSSGVNIIIGAGITFIYIGYLTWTAVAMLQVDDTEERLIMGLIVSLILLTYVLIGIWPISTVYSTVIMTIVYYMLLNLALEMRTNITRYIWFEYVLLFSLIIVIMFSNAIWGVNGTLL
jgi:hypothetical protein